MNKYSVCVTKLDDRIANHVLIDPDQNMYRQNVTQITSAPTLDDSGTGRDDLVYYIEQCLIIAWREGRVMCVNVCRRPFITNPSSR